MSLLNNRNDDINKNELINNEGILINKAFMGNIFI
jgi:hypothetical protein